MAKVRRTPREAVARELGVPIPDTAWNQAVHDGLEEELELENLSPKEVAERMRAYASIRSSPSPPEKPNPSVPAAVPNADLLWERAQAISAWAARATRADPKVKMFRTTHLRKGLLAPTEIHRWVLTAYVHNLHKIGRSPESPTLEVPDFGKESKSHGPILTTSFLNGLSRTHMVAGSWADGPCLLILPSESFLF